jgi:thiol-disulfide isomerase/thioredoxin
MPYKRKIVAVVISILVLILAGCRIKKDATGISSTRQINGSTSAHTGYSDQSTWLLGYFSPERLLRPPYSEWFYKEYDHYRPDEEVIEKLKKTGNEGLDITVVMGTWCPDSRREVPRFMNIIDKLNFPKDNLTFIGVDNSKQSPIGGFDTLNIEWVPTFIFLKNKVETGRIIENPEASLEQDMLNILTRNEK